MQLSQKQKIFSEFFFYLLFYFIYFFAFSKFRVNFKHFTKKDEPHS